MRLRWHLTVLSIAAVVPLLAFAGVMVRQHLDDGRELLHRGMGDTARALTVAVDGEVKAAWAVLETLAGSPFLDAGDLGAFQELCVRAVADRPGAWVVLFDRSGQQVANSSRRFGTPLPNPFRQGQPANPDARYPALPLGGAEPVRRVFDAGERVVSDLFVALDSRRPTIAVAVPVRRQGEVRYVLEMSVDPDVFTRLLAEQRPPRDAIETIVDGRGLVIARTGDLTSPIGGPMAPQLAAQIARADEGAGEGTTSDGVAVYHVFTRSRLTGWRTSVSVDQDVLNATVDRSVLYLSAGAILAALVSVAVAFLAARRIATPISTLASSAGAIARGMAVPLGGSTVREVTELRDALAAAGEAAHAAATDRSARLVAEARQAEAQSASHAKDEFIAVLGHELRNPLGVIGGAAGLLDQPGVAPVVAQRYPPIIRRQVRHLSRLVDDLLDVSRLTSGKITLIRQPVDLAELARNVVEEWRTSGRLDSPQLTLEASSVWVDADITRLEQVFENLATNALKYTPAGGRIDVTVGPDEWGACLRVRDTGVGIPDSLLPRVFDLFTQGRLDASRHTGGLGIGLTLVRRLVELHGGAVLAESEGQGHGSTFTIRLPRVSRPAATAKPEAGFVTKGVSAHRVLIVHADEDTRHMVRDTLALRGYEVFEAADAASGVEAAQRVRPEAALVDVRPAGLDGHEIARRLRLLGDKRLRLVALTASDSPEDRARALEAGFDESLVSPVHPQTLETALRGGPPPGRSVGAMVRRYDALQDAVDQVRWARQLRQQSRATRRVSALRRAHRSARAGTCF